MLGCQRQVLSIEVPLGFDFRRNGRIVSARPVAELVGIGEIGSDRARQSAGLQQAHEVAKTAGIRFTFEKSSVKGSRDISCEFVVQSIPREVVSMEAPLLWPELRIAGDWSFPAVVIMPGWLRRRAPATHRRHLADRPVARSSLP